MNRYNNYDEEQRQRRHKDITFNDYRITGSGFSTPSSGPSQSTTQPKRQSLPVPYGHADYSGMTATTAPRKAQAQPHANSAEQPYKNGNYPKHDPLNYPAPLQQRKHAPGHNILAHFGIYPSVPALNVLKLAAIIVLVLLVEVNIIMNLESSQLLYEITGYSPYALVGIGIIGIILGMLYRYFDFELEQQRMKSSKQQRTDFMGYLKMGVVLIIMIFLILEVFVELIVTRGFLFLIDITSITIMAIGTYAIFSGKRPLTIISLLFIFIIMLLGVDASEPNIPLLTFLAVLTIVYIELSDGASRLQEYYLKFHDMAKPDDMHAKAQIDHQINSLTIKFCTNFGIFIVFTLIVSGLLLMLYMAYPYLTPEFMSENLELKTIYAFIPIIFLLFFIFMIIYLFTPKYNAQSESDSEFE
jgi:hypothetical protein